MLNLGKTQRQSRGFTIIELLVVVAVIGILISIGAVSYGDYRKTVTIAQLKSDLNSVATVMENARNFDNSYPNSVPATFAPSSGVTLSGGSADVGQTYCVDAVSASEPGVYYYIDSLVGMQGAQPGSCVTSRAIPQNLTATTASNTSINVSWDPVSHATSYTLQRDTNPAFPSPVIINQSGTTSTATVTQGINYYFRVNATIASATSNWSDTVADNTSISAPTAPVIAVTLSGANIQASINTPVTCTTGTPQYEISARTNDGTWGAYTAWSTTTTASQVATEGVKYGYKAEARCYVSSNLYGSSTTGSEGTYIYQFVTTPSAPTVSASAPDWATTTYSWNAATCPAGSAGNYQYHFTTSYGYDSGWISNGASASVNLTTSSAGYTYTLAVQTQCASPYSSSSWSTSGSASYYRPYTVTAMVIAGGGAGGAGDSYGNGGGGGAGGVIYQTGFVVSPGSYGVTVGGGGGNGGSGNSGNSGGNSSFAGQVAIGGGGGGGGANNHNGSTGGSGGGASASSSSSTSGSAGTSGQGHAGGNSCSSGNRTAGGGGGATGGNYYFNGGCLSGSRAGDGGTGIVFDISGTSLCYAAGGGGGIGSGTEGMGGTSQQNGAGIGCGAGRAHQTQGGDSASGNTGSGGGGGYHGGGNGGSGIVIIRYPTGELSANGGSSVYTVGSDTVQVFYGSGTFTIN